MNFTRLIAFLLMSLVAAGVAADEKERLTQELMHASGLKRQIEQLPSGIVLGIEQHPMPKEIRDALRSAMQKAYSAESIEKKVSATMSERLDEKLLVSALEWLNSDLGKEITRLEEAASSPEGYQAIQAYGQQLQRSPPSPERLKLAQEMDAATHATDIAVTVIEAGELGIALGIDAIRLPDEQRGLEKLLEEVAADRPNLTAGLRDLNIVGFLYTYHTLEEEEISRYLEFLRSETGVKYQEAATAGLKEALLQSAAETARSLPAALKSEQSKRSI
jgi:hypothetical protein